MKAPRVPDGDLQHGDVLEEGGLFSFSVTAIAAI